MKKFYKALSGLLILAITLFEISETKRFASLVAEGNSDYVGELVAKAFFIIAIIISAILLWMGKNKASAFSLTAAGGVAIYKAFVYITNIIGNEMIFGIVLGNIIDMIEITLFIVPSAVIMLLGKTAVRNNVCNSLIATFAAFIIGFAGRIITFVSWGKSFATDIPLLFSAYGTDMLRTVVMFAAFALLLLGFMPEKRKNLK